MAVNCGTIANLFIRHKVIGLYFSDVEVLKFICVHHDAFSISMHKWESVSCLPVITNKTGIC